MLVQTKRGVSSKVLSVSLCSSGPLEAFILELNLRITPPDILFTSRIEEDGEHSSILGGLWRFLSFESLSGVLNSIFHCNEPNFGLKPGIGLTSKLYLTSSSYLIRTPKRTNYLKVRQPFPLGWGYEAHVL